MRTKQIATHWDEVLRIGSSVRTGTVTASLILGKLAVTPGAMGWREP